MSTVELPRQFKAGRIGVSDVATEPQPDGGPWTTRWTGANRDVPMPLGTGGGYVYRRDRDGWIRLGPSSRTDQERFLILGDTFLPQYGEHEGGPDVMGREYDMLFRLGGQKEMPVEQVIQMGFASKAPVVDGKPIWVDSPVEAFPQLEGVDVPQMRKCRYCSRELWLDEQEQSHVSVMHADRIAAFEQANAIASGMAEAVAVGKASVQETPVIERPKAAMVCGFCNSGFEKIPEFLKHVKECRNGQEG